MDKFTNELDQHYSNKLLSVSSGKENFVCLNFITYLCISPQLVKSKHHPTSIPPGHYVAFACLVNSKGDAFAHQPLPVGGAFEITIIIL